MHMGDFFGRLGPEKKYFATFFFGSALWGTHFGTHFWTHFGPILDPFLTKFWVKTSTVWSLWVNIEAINRSQMASRCLR